MAWNSEITLCISTEYQTMLIYNSAYQEWGNDAISKLYTICLHISTARIINSLPDLSHCLPNNSGVCLTAPTCEPQSSNPTMESAASTSNNSNVSQTSIPITPGYAVAIALGGLLIIQFIMVCTTACVVCFKRIQRKREMNREGTGSLHGNTGIDE